MSTIAFPARGDRYFPFDPRYMMGNYEIIAKFGLARTPKPCPFCKKDFPVMYITTPRPHMTCTRCGADGPLAIMNPGDVDLLQLEALEKWNMR